MFKTRQGVGAPHVSANDCDEHRKVNINTKLKTSKQRKGDTNNTRTGSSKTAFTERRCSGGMKNDSDEFFLIEEKQTENDPCYCIKRKINK